MTWINAKTLLERFSHMTNYGWELQDRLLPVSLTTGYAEVLLNTPRVTTAVQAARLMLVQYGMSCACSLWLGCTCSAVVSPMHCRPAQLSAG